MLTDIYLHGHLADKYGDKFTLDVDSVAGAIGLLRANFNSFARDVVGHNYNVWVGKSDVGPEELGNHVNGNDIHIIPVVAGGDNVVKVIVGAVLVIVGVLTSWAGGEVLVEVGIMLIIQGVAGMIFSASMAPISLELTVNGERPSYAFNGPVNTTMQGNPVPILYGRALVGSLAVSGAIKVGGL